MRLKIVNIVQTIAFLLLPWQYQAGQCLTISKDVQSEYGGTISFIEPRYLNNSVMEGEIGHWINKIHGYYIDYYWQRIFSNESEVIEWYTNTTGYPNAYVVDEEGT